MRYPLTTECAHETDILETFQLSSCCNSHSFQAVSLMEDAPGGHHHLKLKGEGVFCPFVDGLINVLMYLNHLNGWPSGSYLVNYYQLIYSP